ncbi:hypothetical protein [Nonomuraea aridisoli]|uniref:Uncharacterized protein n=1 Tax=Nonomuraea aridisoli TaxID=2070368 RepID=A0A2W2E1T1_9ACTN|nr:hypothetical protein [Nonomuraea aridisoli]PZG18166.1 hypothetical protein C1J01_15895 [Nonomuraea aridisoli]
MDHDETAAEPATGTSGSHGRNAFGYRLLGLKESANPAVAVLSDVHGDLVATFTTDCSRGKG